MKPLLIFGAGGHAASVIATAHAAGIFPDAVAVDNPAQQTFLGIPLLSSRDVEAMRSGFEFVVAIGDCSVRRAKFDWLVALGGIPKIVIHPRANVSEFTEVGAGTVIMALAHIDPCVSVGENCIINAGAMVGHGSNIESDCHISANACLGGNCMVASGSWVGLGSAIKEGVRIGEKSFIGLGAIVSHNIPSNHKAISPHRKEAIVLPIHLHA